jgi:hypothetical protein
LKYFYLLFGPEDLLPLDQIVLNTEAHPFPRFDASRKRFKTGWKRIPRDKEGELILPKQEEEKKKKKEDEKKVDGEKEEAKVETKKEEAKVETKKEVVEEDSKSKGKVTKKARVMRVPKVDKVT